MSQRRVDKWYKYLKKRSVDVEVDNYPEHPSRSISDNSVEQVKKIILENPPIIIREFAHDVGISFGFK